MIEILFDPDDVRVWPVCQVEDCGVEVRRVDYDSMPGDDAQDDHRVLPNRKDGTYTARPCGHEIANPESLVWVVYEAEADCGV